MRAIFEGAVSKSFGNGAHSLVHRSSTAVRGLGNRNRSLCDARRNVESDSRRFPDVNALPSPDLESPGVHRGLGGGLKMAPTRDAFRRRAAHDYPEPGSPRPFSPPRVAEAEFENVGRAVSGLDDRLHRGLPPCSLSWILTSTWEPAFAPRMEDSTTTADRNAALAGLIRSRARAMR